MLNTLIVVWRESLEAMLVIGILLAWAGRQTTYKTLRHGLWLGVIGGIGLALGLGAATFAVQSQLAGESLALFQLAMVMVAAALIVQMVLWMHRHGHAMRLHVEREAGRTRDALGLGGIAALAVAREGAETVVFLYGLVLQAQGAELWALLGSGVAGFGLAALTCAAVMRGLRGVPVARLFRISEVALLLIAAALLANGVDRLLSMDWVSPLIDPVWDSSALLDDGHGLGRVLADFAGYRARPTGIWLLVLATYTGFVTWRLKRIDTTRVFGA